MTGASATQVLLCAFVVACVFALGAWSARLWIQSDGEYASEDEERNLDKMLAARGHRLAPSISAPAPQGDERVEHSPLPFQCQPTEHRGSVIVRTMLIPDVVMQPSDSFSAHPTMGAEWTVDGDTEIGNTSSGSPSSGTKSPSKVQAVWSQATDNSGRFGVEAVGSILECDEDSGSDDNSGGGSPNTLIAASPRTLGIQPSQGEILRRGPGRALRKKPANPVPLAVQRELDEEVEIPLSDTLSECIQGSNPMNEGTASGTSSRGSRHTWHQRNPVDDDEEALRVRFRT